MHVVISIVLGFTFGIILYGIVHGNEPDSVSDQEYEEFMKFMEEFNKKHPKND